MAGREEQRGAEAADDRPEDDDGDQAWASVIATAPTA